MNNFASKFIPFALAIAASTSVIVTPFAAQVQAAELADSGAFRDADASHKASGSAQIIKLKGGGLGLKLDSRFKVRGGPDLRVWLSASGNPTNTRSVKGAQQIDLGRLKSSSGEQIYRIPAGVSISQLQSVVIWCRAFGVNFAALSLGEVRTLR